MNDTNYIVNEISKDGISRINMWIKFINHMKLKSMVEIGVYKGDFASEILTYCSSIERYYMVDPWRHLDNWNKPANTNNVNFEKFLSETQMKTDFSAHKRIILRGMTTEVIDNIQDNELDFAYIDGDHTLRGISVDLLSVFPKIKVGGFIGGDDFSETIWQHGYKYEPTFVFPYALYFAEAVKATLYTLPNSQFLIEKNSDRSFSYINNINNYQDTTVMKHINIKALYVFQIRKILDKIRSYIKKI